MTEKFALFLIDIMISKTAVVVSVPISSPAQPLNVTFDSVLLSAIVFTIPISTSQITKMMLVAKRYLRFKKYAERKQTEFIKSLPNLIGKSSFAPK